MHGDVTVVRVMWAEWSWKHTSGVFTETAANFIYFCVYSLFNLCLKSFIKSRYQYCNIVPKYIHRLDSITRGKGNVQEPSNKTVVI